MASWPINRHFTLFILIITSMTVFLNFQWSKNNQTAVSVSGVKMWCEICLNNLYHIFDETKITKQIWPYSNRSTSHRMICVWWSAMHPSVRNYSISPAISPSAPSSSPHSQPPCFIMLTPSIPLTSYKCQPPPPRWPHYSTCQTHRASPKLSLQSLQSRKKKNQSVNSNWC